MFVGEFGAFSAADMPSRARWTRFVSEESRQLGMSRAYWEFGSGFGAYDPQTDT
jgi:endoglucanase